MGISRFNSEGYYDPTAHEAVCNIEKEARKWRPLVYICSPYSGDVDRNTEKARRYCRFAVDQGAIPFSRSSAPAAVHVRNKRKRPCSLYGYGSDGQMRTGVGIRRKGILRHGSRDCKGKEEKHDNPLFHGRVQRNQLRRIRLWN